jgi:hypothetical protein
MIKKIVVSACLLLSLVSFAQEGTASPYSYYGIGDIRFKGTVENQSMGGLRLFSDSIHVSLRNPAAYGRLKLTTYTVGETNDLLANKLDTSFSIQKWRSKQTLRMFMREASYALKQK